MKDKINKIITTFLIGCLLSNQALACAHSGFSKYYSKTIEVPTMKDIALSDVPIHTKPYYEWVIKEKTENQINHKNTLDDIDDWAVAYNKTGQKEKAIEILNEVLKNNPNRYSSLSNIASAYINLNDYDKGLEYLHKANQLKSDDDYDREYAQEKVYSYLKELNQKAPFSFPVKDSLDNNFANYVVKNLKDKSEESEKKELLKVFYGIYNMVRFGNTDNPVFSEAMGDILNYINNKYLNNNYDLKYNIEFFYMAAYVKGENKKDIRSINKFLEFNISEYQLKEVDDLYKEIKSKREKVKLGEIELINNSNNLDEKSLDKIINENLIKNVKNKTNQLNLKEQLNKFIEDIQQENKVLNTISIIKNLLNIFSIMLFIIFSILLFILPFTFFIKNNNNDEIKQFKKVSRNFIYMTGISFLSMFLLDLFNFMYNEVTNYLQIIFSIMFLILGIKSIQKYNQLAKKEFNYKKTLITLKSFFIIFVSFIIFVNIFSYSIDIVYIYNGYKISGNSSNILNSRPLRVIS